ncbi:hypothetical protein [Eilatimonas milleporae]|uniref:Cation transporter n=1 Tax=Eilatimonas milleporae TaxID=911205 RepID=A0A3M0CS10_9PROT|nr:hypothetical protein [Eilatimonas milleporae]RMB12371.1 hypothetical protein BXY39_0867 [Eilatimonas milleporae]
MPAIDTDLVMKLRPHLRISRHKQGRVRLRYKMAAISVLRQAQKAPDNQVFDTIAGVKKVEVSPLTFTLTVHYDPAVIRPEWWETLLAGSDSDARAVLERFQAA